MLPADPPSSSTLSPDLLLVSDDDTLLPLLAPRLQAHGLSLERRPMAGDGPVPLRASRHGAALVDLRRDPERGLVVVEGLRLHHPGLRLLALLPRGGIELPLRVGDAGADDFCWGLDDGGELIARLLRLTRPRPGPGRLVVGDLEMEAETGRVWRLGRLLELPRRQQELLQLLMCHAGEVLSRERIEAELALVPGERRSNLVEVHVHHLRRQLGPGRLLTLRGQGYRLADGTPVADATERTLRE